MVNASIQVAIIVNTNPMSAQSNSKGASTCDVFTRKAVNRIQTTSVPRFFDVGTDLSEIFLKGPEAEGATGFRCLTRDIVVIPNLVCITLMAKAIN